MIRIPNPPTTPRDRVPMTRHDRRSSIPHHRHEYPVPWLVQDLGRRATRCDVAMMPSIKQRATRAPGEHVEKMSWERSMNDETLEIGPNGAWFEWRNERVSLTRRGPMKRILCVLAENHQDTKPIDVYSLFERAWDSETQDPEKDAQRVYNNVSKLRGMGLDDAILKSSDGYMFDPEIRVIQHEHLA